MKTRMLFAMLSLTLAACDDPKPAATDAPKPPAAASAAQPEAKAKEAPPAAAAGSAQPAASTAQASPPPGDDLAVKGDFEEEAQKAITAANYKAELDSIEAELK